MSGIAKEMNRWFEMLMSEWSAEISLERKPYLWNKMLFTAMEAATRDFMYYRERPSYREQALINAVAVREFAEGFSDDKTDFNQIANSICDRQIGFMDGNSSVSQEELDALGITEEEWEAAVKSASHDESGDLLRPQVAGFVTGAYYEVPIKEDTEFDGEKAFKVVRACIHQALKKVNEDVAYCLSKFAKSNNNYWKGIWMSKVHEAKEDKRHTEAFIKQHGLVYEDQ